MALIKIDAECCNIQLSPTPTLTKTPTPTPTPSATPG